MAENGTAPGRQAALESKRMRHGVLVLDHHGFGNVIMSLPLLEALERALPASVVRHVLLASPAHYELVRENVTSFEPVYLREHRGWQGFWRLRRRLRNKVDVVLGVPQVPAKVTAAVKLLVGARQAVGETGGFGGAFLTERVERGDHKSILATQVEMLARLGIDGVVAPPRLRLTADEQAWAAREAKASGVGGRRFLLGLHASAEKANKRWPPERFGAVVAGVRTEQPDVAVISFGSAAERPDAERARTAVSDVAWCEGTGEWTLRQSAALMQQCDLFVCGDTGLMHLAAAVGVPTLAVFGPTSPARLAPPGAQHVSVAPSTPCHPCYGKKGYRDCRCIRTILPDVVAARAAALSKPRC